MEKKIKKLELIEKILIAGTVLVGIITIIDIFIPDPILLLDEAALTAITGLLTYIANLVRRRVEELKKGEKSSIGTKQIEEVTAKVTETAKTVKKSRNKQYKETIIINNSNNIFNRMYSNTIIKR